MITLQRILFATDFSPSAERAFDLALVLAHGFDAELVMFHAVVLHEDDPHNPAHHFPDPEAIHRRLEGLADSAMAELMGRGRASEARIRQVKSRGIAAAPTILEYAEQWDADLIVMGSEGRRGPSHLLLGSVAEEVVSHARCAVMTVRGDGEAVALETFDRILAPVDFSDHSRAALKAARELGERYGAEVHALHVVEDVVYPAYFGQNLDLSEELAARAEKALEEMVSDTPGPGSVERHVVVAHRAAPEIARFARRRECDLVVQASHGLGGVEEFLFGTTAKRLVQLCPVPLLTLKAFGKGLLSADG